MEATWRAKLSTYLCVMGKIPRSDRPTKSYCYPLVAVVDTNFEHAFFLAVGIIKCIVSVDLRSAGLSARRLVPRCRHPPHFFARTRCVAEIFRALDRIAHPTHGSSLIRTIRRTGISHNVLRREEWTHQQQWDASHNGPQRLDCNQFSNRVHNTHWLPSTRHGIFIYISKVRHVSFLYPQCHKEGRC